MVAKKTVLTRGLEAIVLAVLLLFYAPLVWTCVKAFWTDEGIGFHWFLELVNDPSFFEALKNSFVLALCSSVFSVGLSSLAVLQLSKSSALRVYDQMMAVSISLPEIVMALSLLSFFSWLGLSLGFFSAWLAHTTLTLAFSFWILSVHFQSLDPSLVEAARDLGADTKSILIQILLPQMRPALFSSFWICFLISLDDFLISFFVTGSSYETLPLKLFSMIKVGLNPKVNALSFLILLVSSLILLGLYGVWSKQSHRKVQP